MTAGREFGNRLLSAPAAGGAPHGTGKGCSECRGGVGAVCVRGDRVASWEVARREGVHS